MSKTFLIIMGIIVGLIVIFVLIGILSDHDAYDYTIQTTEKKMGIVEKETKIPEKKSPTELDLKEIESRLKAELSEFIKAEVELKEEDGNFDIYVDYNGYRDKEQAGVMVLTVKFVGKDMLDILEKFGEIYFLRFGEKELKLLAPDCGLIMLQKTPEEKEAMFRGLVKPIKNDK